MSTVTDKDILRYVRQRIQRRQNTFICHAIHASRIGTERQKRSLILWVEKMLGGYTTYDNWMRTKHPAKYAEFRNSYYSECMVAARLAWLDWMIEQV